MLFHIATATSYFTAPNQIPMSSANPNTNPNANNLSNSASSGSLNANAVGHPSAPTSSNPATVDGASTTAAGGMGSTNSSLSGGMYKVAVPIPPNHHLYLPFTNSASNSVHKYLQ